MKALQGEHFLGTAQMRETSLLDQRQPLERETGWEPSCFEGFVKGGKEQQKPSTARDGRGFKGREGIQAAAGAGKLGTGIWGRKGVALGLTGAPVWGHWALGIPKQGFRDVQRPLRDAQFIPGYPSLSQDIQTTQESRTLQSLQTLGLNFTKFPAFP